MGHTRVVYTNSTTAECNTILKMFNFQEESGLSFWVRPDDSGIKVYLVWGRATYYPELTSKVRFTPRVQIHLKSREQPESLDNLTREMADALGSLDPSSGIQVFDAETGSEIPSGKT